MKTCTQLSAFPGNSRPVVLAAGSFDGVHRGHQFVIRQAIERAASLEGEAWVLTFHPHPSKVLRPSIAYPLLTNEDEKRRRIHDLHPHGLLELGFTDELASQQPEEFIRGLVENIPSLLHVVVGVDWRFGRGAAGNAKLLTQLGEELGFEVLVVPLVEWNEAPISSTRIRKGIADGHFEAVTEMMGRHYELQGTVVRGRQAGRRLGYPTANIVPRHGVLPAHGVYAVTCNISDLERIGAGYYGHRSARPDRDGEYFFEVYLFDFSDDLYGKSITINLVSFIRPDRYFNDEVELQRQIKADIEAVKLALNQQGHGIERTTI